MTENGKKRMMELLLTFCMVTTGGLIVCVVYINIFGPHDTLLKADILWQLLAMALLCSLGNFIHPYREISRRRIMLNRCLHYLYINAAVLGCGYGFAWIDRGNLLMPVVMIVGILFVFVAVASVIWKLHAKESEILNRKLKEYQRIGGVD